MRRRTALRVGGGAAAALAGARSVDNVLIGYGVLVGTNLVEQDLRRLARPDLVAWERSTGRVGGRQVAVGPDRLTVDGDRYDLTRPPGTADRPGGPVGDLVVDLRTLRAGEARWQFSTSDRFFETLRAGRARPHAVAALRGSYHPPADPAVLAEFADADPADPAALTTGLVEGFREHGGYDVARYVAGAVQDNVLAGAVDLRRPFRGEADFRALLESDRGLFCYEFAARAVEAFHAVPAAEQTVPVLAGKVLDRRHKHVYSALAGLVRREGELVVAVTFLDYTHTTLYDDLGLRGVLGEGLEAYGRRHRATEFDWCRPGPPPEGSTTG